MNFSNNLLRIRLGAPDIDSAELEVRNEGTSKSPLSRGCVRRSNICPKRTGSLLRKNARGDASPETVNYTAVRRYFPRRESPRLVASKSFDFPGREKVLDC